VGLVSASTENASFEHGECPEYVWNSFRFCSATVERHGPCTGLSCNICTLNIIRILWVLLAPKDESTGQGHALVPTRYLLRVDLVGEHSIGIPICWTFHVLRNEEDEALAVSRLRSSRSILYPSSW